jgi:hypothetical protein
MRREFVLASVVLTGALVTAAATIAAQQAPAGAPAGAQAPGREGGQGRGGGRGAPQVPGPIEKVADNLYMIPGAGGNSGVFLTANGVVLVDTKNPNNGQGILDQVKTVTDKPVTHIINTHTHGDHNGSNIFFPPTVEIVTQENTAANMKKMPAFQDAANAHGLPDRTYKDRPVLLRPRAHERRYVRRVPERARHAYGRCVREQGESAHRRQQRRKRPRMGQHARQGRQQH